MPLSVRSNQLIVIQLDDVSTKVTVYVSVLAYSLSKLRHVEACLSDVLKL